VRKASFGAVALVIGLVANFFSPVIARADLPVAMLRDCANTPNRPCIESIFVTTNTGKRIQAVLTGEHATGDGGSESSLFGGGPENIDDEYSLQGLTFESPSGNRFIARNFYNGQWMQAVVEPSWIHGTPESSKATILTLPHRPTNLYCGSAASPQPCGRNLMFNQNITFEEKIRLPKSFVIAYVNSRTDKLSFQTGLDPKTINGNDFVTTDFTFHVTKKEQVLFAPLLPNPLDSSQFADFEIDQTIVNFYTPQDPNSQALGACSGIPSISVISNGLNPDTPRWSPQDQTISVQVWGPHFTVNGDLNEGYFQAKISKEIGKCLWGIDLGNQTQAEVKLTEGSDSQSSHIETVSGVFDGENYVITDSNFHFSNPKLSIKLSNSAQATPTPTPTPKTVMLKSLECTLGKKTIKISALKPACPKGYRSKK